MRLDEKGEVAPNDPRARDPRLHDPPKPVVRLEGRSELSEKIAKLSQRLSADEAGRTGGAGGAARVEAPALIMSGSLSEARAYIPHITPAASEEPITRDMHRVRVADEVNAVTWVTERIERKPQLVGTEGSLGEREASAQGPAEGEVDEEAERWARGRARRRGAALLAAFSVVLGVVGLAGFTLVWKPAQARPVLTAQAAELIPPGIMDQVAALYEEVSPADEPAQAGRGRREGLAGAANGATALNRGAPWTGQRGHSFLAGARKGTGVVKEESEPPKKTPQRELILQ